jgi:hypothetical protein
MSSISSIPVRSEIDGARAQSPAIDPDKAMDLYALWNSVFANSRIDSDRDSDLANPDREPAPSADQTLKDEHTHAQPLSLVRESGIGGSTGLLSVPPSAALLPAADVVRASVDALAILSVQGNGPAFAPAYPAQASTPNAATRAEGLLAPPASRVETGLRPAGMPDATQAPAASETASTAEAMPVQETHSTEPSAGIGADSVNVFVRGSMVAIVVRDAAIGDAEAVNCAFETAQKLTGQRAALRQLTLNGRVLYQQPIDATADLPRASLVFTC